MSRYYSRNNMGKLTKQQWEEITIKARSGCLYEELAKEYGINRNRSESHTIRITSNS